MIWAQLNWIPLAIAAGILLLSGLFLVQRRRARAPRLARISNREKKQSETAATKATAANTVVGSESFADATPDVAVAAIGAVAFKAAETTGIEESIAPATVADPARQARTATIAEQAKRVMAGEDYDQSIVGSDDRDTRRLVGDELLSALVGRNVQRRDRARAAFMQHGYFDDATRDLRIAESAHERAAAARRLSFVRHREATPHLIAALDDSDPDVRRTAIEALTDLRDPAAIAPLNSLMQSETDRRVSRTLIKHAIESCATGGGDELSPIAAASTASAPLPELSTQPVKTEREVIEL